MRQTPERPNQDVDSAARPDALRGAAVLADELANFAPKLAKLVQSLRPAE